MVEQGQGGQADRGGVNRFRARVNEVEHLGSFKRLFITVDGFDEIEFKADLNKNQMVSVGENVTVRIPPDAIRLYGREATS